MIWLYLNIFRKRVTVRRDHSNSSLWPRRSQGTAVPNSGNRGCYWEGCPGVTGADSHTRRHLRGFTTRCGSWAAGRPEIYVCVKFCLGDLAVWREMAERGLQEDCGCVPSSLYWDLGSDSYTVWKELAKFRQSCLPLKTTNRRRSEQSIIVIQPDTIMDTRESLCDLYYCHFLENTLLIQFPVKTDTYTYYTIIVI